MHKLYSFSDPSGEREIVVISEETQEWVCKEFADGRDLDKVLSISGNATALPCDRILKPEF